MDNVTIANMALLYLAQREIAALDDSTLEGRIINRFFNPTLEETLRAVPWNFATRRAANLARNATAPAFEFTYSYILPNDPYCLRPLSMYNSASMFRIEGRNLLTNDSKVDLIYIARITDPAQFDAIFSSALSYHLAAKIAYPINRSKTTADEMYALYYQKRDEAIIIDNQEGLQTAATEDDYINNRK